MSESMIGKKIGNYNVTRQLGEGGMGAVYLGEHPLIGKRVAIKVLHDELSKNKDIVQRFFTEARAVNDIHHDNIVDIVDFGQVRDENGSELVYFIMEQLEGENLGQRIKRGPVSFQEAIHVISQCAGALAASHAHEIVHRDIKPDNIFLIRRGQDQAFVKLLDFGIAKLTGAQAVSGMTRAGSVIGTPAYMSPEQCDGKGNIDWRSDIYSLGIVMYELLCRRVPFLGTGFGEILVAQLTLAPAPPSALVPTIPAALEAIVLRCLEKSRADRFQSMDELRDALLSSGAYVPPRGFTGANALIQQRHSEPSIPAVYGPSTTLSHSASELRPATGSGAVAEKSRAPLYALVSLAALGAGFGAVALLHSNGRSGSVVAATAPAAIAVSAPPVELVTLLFDSTPEGATITRAGEATPLGKTPHTMKLAKGTPTFDVLFSLGGFKSETRTLTINKDRDVLVSLTKFAASPSASPSHGGAGHAGHGSSRPMERAHLPADEGKIGLMPDQPRRHDDQLADPDGVLAPGL